MREQGDRKSSDLSESTTEPPPAEETDGLEELAKLPLTLWNQRLKRISEVLAVPAAILLLASAVFSIKFSISFFRGQSQSVEPSAKAVESQAAVSPTPKPSPLEQVLREKPTLISDFINSQNLSDEQAMASLRLYIDNGVKFRRQVLYAQLTGGEQSVIQSYSFLKNALLFETSEASQPHQVDEYNVGDVVRVTDFNKPHGIYLRQSSTLEANPQDPFTYDGNSLKILDGPYDLLDEVKKEAWGMWRVRKVSFCGPSGWQPTCYEGVAVVPEEGWIWQGWFGLVADRHPLSPTS